MILFFALALSIIGCAGNCNTNNKLSGTIYISGNEPFTFLAIATDDQNRTVYRIECSDLLKNDLWKLQGKTVELNYDKIKEFEKLNIAVITGYSVKDLENQEK